MSTDAAAADLVSPDALARLVRARRTTKLLDPDRPVDPSIVDSLCELATWAPNHKRTEPWRFAVVTGDGRRRLGETLADALAAEGGHEAKVTKTRTKYFRAPVVVVVGAAPGGDPVTTGENRDAVAAGIEILLLAATTHGLGTLWSSVSPPSAPPVLDLLGFPPDTFVVGAVHLGHMQAAEADGHRSPPVINHIR